MTRDYTLTEDFELQGYWWLPEKEERKVPGRLIRKDQEMNLHLLDTLVELSLQERGIVRPPPRPPLILGWLDDGRVCTLYKNWEDGFRFTTSGFQTATFKSQMLFLGKHFPTEDDLTFSAMSASHTYMEDWLRYNPFDSKWPESDGSQITTEAKYVSFPTQTFPVSGINASVSLEPLFQANRSLRHHEWHHSVHVKVALSSEPKLTRYLDVLTDCRNLLTLFVGVPVQARTIVVYRDRPAVDGEGSRQIYAQGCGPASRRLNLLAKGDV